MRVHQYEGGSMEERQWVHAIRKGDKQCLQDIAEKYYDDIFRFCAFFTGSREDAYDLAQETFLRFIRYAERYRDRNLKGYLLTIAANVCRNDMGKRGREREAVISIDTYKQDGYGEDSGGQGLEEWKNLTQAVPQGQVLPEQHAVAADIHDRLMQALASLPDMQREAILLYYLHEMKYREISKMTGVSVSTVKSRVRQGMEKLQGSLKREDFILE